MPKKKLNNAQVLRAVQEIGTKWEEENGEKLFTPNFEKFVEEILSKSDDDICVNAYLNKGLKPNPAIKL